MEALGTTTASRKITRSYLTNRKAEIMVNNIKVETTLTKGCPQGSRFGPTLWNITVNCILKRSEDDKTHRVAYADDIVQLIAGNTRNEIIQKAEEQLRNLQTWAERYELQFSPTKSMGMILKGDLVHGFTIEFGNNRLRTANKI
jgi:hypothetical protein